MTAPDRSIPAEPPPELRFRRRVRTGAALAELARSTAVIRSLAERELRARYKQAALGFAWAILTPLALMVVLTVFFRRVADVDTGGAPYAVFAYLGLLPWTFFSTSVSLGGQSLHLNATLLNKVYVPREVFPLASTTVAGADMVTALVPLAGLFLVTGFAPRGTSVWVPVLLLLQIAFTVAVTLIISVVLVYLRDVRHALPILLQLGLFASPVAYGLDAVPADLHWLYAILNPLAPVIDGYRRTVMLGLAPDWGLVGIATAATVVLLAGGYRLFKHLETGIADVA